MSQFDFDQNQPNQTALPATARLFGSDVDTNPNPTSWGRDAIWNYVNTKLAAIALTGDAGALSGGTVPTARLPSRLQDIVNPTYVQGDVLYFNGTNLVRLAAGTPGFVLTTNGPASNPTWNPGGGAISPGTSPIVGGTNQRLLFDDNGTLNETALVTYDKVGLQLLVPDGSVVAGNNPGLAFQGLTTTGLGANADNLALWVSGIIGCNINDRVSPPFAVRIPVDYAFAWSSAANNNAAADTLLYRDAAGILAQRNGANAQAFHIYNTTDGLGNTEFGGMGWGSNKLFIATNQTGTGTGRGIVIQAASPGTIEVVSDTTFDSAIRPNNNPAIVLNTTTNLSGGSGFEGLILQGAGSGLTTRMTIAGNNVWQFGQGDAATATAQTVQVQSVAAGNLNVAGADWTFNASRGTGTGIGGDIVFQTAPQGGAGSSQNALAPAFRIRNNVGGALNGLQLFNASGNPGLSSVSQADAGFIRFTNSLFFGRVGGQEVFNVDGSAGGVSAVKVLQNAGLGFFSDNGGTFTTGFLPISAGVLQRGASDSATPVAQTTQVQSVVAGTSNTAGVDWTFIGSKGTGTGVGGKFVWQVAAAGGSGTSQNAATTLMTLNPSNGALAVGASGTGFITGSQMSVITNSGTFTLGTGLDAILSWGGAATWQLGAGASANPIAQTLTVQGVGTGVANTAGVDWTFIGSTGTGTGTAGNIKLQTTFKGVTQSAVSVTATNASPCVVTLTNHGFVPGQTFQFGGTAAPGGSALNTTYYVLTVLSANTFTLALTLANFLAGTVFNSSSTGTAVTLTSQTTVQNPASLIATWGPSGVTGSQTTPLLNLAQSWNTSGVVTALKVNVTNTASGAGSLLLDLQVGGTSQFNVSPTGTVSLPNVTNALYNSAETNSSFGFNLGSPVIYKTGTQVAQFGVGGILLGGLSTLGAPAANLISTSGAWATTAPNTQSGTTYTMVSTDATLIFTNAGACTITLLAASGQTGRVLWVKDTNATGTLVSASSNVVPLAGGAAGTAILAAGGNKWARLQSDGTNWIITAAN